MLKLSWRTHRLLWTVWTIKKKAHSIACMCVVIDVGVQVISADTRRHIT